METIAPKTTEEVVREVLGKTYNQFGFDKDDKQIARYVALLEDPEKAVPEDEGDASEAAEEIRTSLWNRYSGGGASAYATCDLFYTLGRQAELGWVEGEAEGYRFKG